MAVVPIILAAGFSARMGRSKPLLEFDGRTCLELALDACRDAGTAPPVVVLGHQADEVRARIPLGEAQVVVNADYGKGQTSSLKAGLRRLPQGAEAFLLHPVDLPLLEAGDVRLLTEAWRGRRGGHQIFIPSHGRRRGHPVLFDAALREEFLTLPDDGSAREVVDRRPGRIAYLEAGEGVLVDMDTPEDYARCLEAFRARGRRRPPGDRPEPF